MKKIVFFLLSIVLYVSPSFAHTNAHQAIIHQENTLTVLGHKTKVDSFKVSGNCGMCEKTIEKAALSVKHVKKADWNKDTKVLVVEYQDGKVDLMDVHKAIAASGYDTDKVRAKDADYNKLHACCQYDRK